MKIELKKALLFKKDIYKKIILDKNIQIDYIDLIAKLLDNKADIIEIDNLNFNDCDLIEVSIKARQLCSIYNSLLIIKNRADIVKIAEADGILTDEFSIELAKIKKISDDNILFGFMGKPKNYDYDFILANENEKYDNIATYEKISDENNIITYKKVLNENN